MSKQTAGTITKLGEFNLTSLENGLVRGAWNILRVLFNTSSDNTLSINVFFNPMFPETGLTGDPDTDALVIPKPFPPRLSIQDINPLSPGGLMIAAGGSEIRVDYFSALPTMSF